MKKLTLSRNTEVDVQKCARLVGGNSSRFDLVHIASARARQIAYQNKASKTQGCLDPGITALLEIQNGILKHE